VCGDILLKRVHVNRVSQATEQGGVQKPRFLRRSYLKVVERQRRQAVRVVLLHELHAFLVHDPRRQARRHAALQVLARDSVFDQVARHGVELGRQVVVEQVPG
jgi:hypothetical protein